MILYQGQLHEIQYARSFLALGNESDEGSLFMRKELMKMGQGESLLRLFYFQQDHTLFQRSVV